MEFVKVTYFRRRKVYIDGVKSGYTNKKLRVSRGTHRFDLGEPVNYQPQRRKPFVKETTPLTPMIIAFNPESPLP